MNLKDANDKFLWSSTFQDTEQLVKSWLVCTQTSCPLPTVSHIPLPIPWRPWSHIFVDFITKLPSYGSGMDCGKASESYHQCITQYSTWSRTWGSTKWTVVVLLWCVHYFYFSSLQQWNSQELYRTCLVQIETQPLKALYSWPMRSGNITHQIFLFSFIYIVLYLAHIYPTVLGLPWLHNSLISWADNQITVW